MNNNRKNKNESSVSGFEIHPIYGVLTVFAKEDVELSNGKVVPKGYLRATDLTKAASRETGKRKEWSKYRKTAPAQEYLEALAELENCTIENEPIAPYGAMAQPQGFKSPLIIVNKGGNNLDETGIFVHPLVAKHYAMWLSPKFAVLAIKVIDAVINGDFKALRPEEERLQREIQKAWQSYRRVTIETFWFIADEIKEYYEQHPRQEKYQGQNYSEVMDKINLGLFGKKSKTIKEELGITKGQLNRDHFGTEALRRIESVQRLTKTQIIKGVNPMDAVTLILELLAYDFMDYKD